MILLKSTVNLNETAFYYSATKCDKNVTKISQKLRNVMIRKLVDGVGDGWGLGHSVWNEFVWFEVYVEALMWGKVGY